MRRLTAAAVERFKPGTKRIEIGDGGSESLRLVIHPSGKKSWAMRFRGPKGKHAKITLGPVNPVGRQGKRFTEARSTAHVRRGPRACR